MISSKTLVFLSVIIEQNNPGKSIRNSESLSIFKKRIQNIRPTPSSTYNCFNIKTGIKHPTRLRHGLSHLRYHKFKHGFLDSRNSICRWAFDIETNCHLLLHCTNFINKISLLLNNTSRLTNDKIALLQHFSYQTFPLW